MRNEQSASPVTRAGESKFAAADHTQFRAQRVGYHTR